MTSNTETELDKLLKEVPPEIGVAISKIAVRYGVGENDPAFLFVRAVHDAEKASSAVTTAALAAVDAAHKVTVEVSRIPGALQAGAQSAVADLRAKVLAAGAEVAQQVAQGLDQNIAATKQAALAEWQAALGRGINAKIREGVVARLAMSWSVVAATIGMAIAIGAVLAVALLHMFDHVTPLGTQFYTNPTGSEVTFAKPITAQFVRCPPGGKAAACMEFRPRR